MKILIASETYLPDVNGAAIFTHRLAKELSKEHTVAVIAPNIRFRNETRKDGNITEYRLKSTSLKPFHPYFRLVYRLGLNERIVSVIRKFKPDIIHIQNHFSVGKACLVAARKLNIPVIGTNHFMPENLLQYFPKPVHKAIAHYMWDDFLHVYEKLDYVTAPSKAAVQMIKDLGLKNRTKVISNGIDLSKFKKVRPSDSFFKKYRIRKGVPVFLFVGRLEVDKNVDRVLRAAKLALKGADLQVIIVGKGKNEDDLRELAKSLELGKSVIFTGKVSDTDLINLYSLTDVYLGSGTAELQGLSVMEAMAAHLPVLAANAVALPELVSNKVNGYLFEANDKDLADKMLKILKDRKKLKEMGERSYKIILIHDVKKTIKSFVTLYKKIVSQKKSGQK